MSLDYIASVVTAYQRMIDLEVARIPHGVRHPQHVKRARRLIADIQKNEERNVEEVVYLFTQLNLHMFFHGVVRFGILPLFLGGNNKK